VALSTSRERCTALRLVAVQHIAPWIRKVSALGHPQSRLRPGELAGISGTMTIANTAGQALLDLHYTLPEPRSKLGAHPHRALFLWLGGSAQASAASRERLPHAVVRASRSVCPTQVVRASASVCPTQWSAPCNSNHNPCLPFHPARPCSSDADDTLWENNIYFERAIAALHRLSQPPRILTRRGRNALNTQESANHPRARLGLTSSRVRWSPRMIAQPGPVTEHNISACAALPAPSPSRRLTAPRR